MGKIVRQPLQATQSFSYAGRSLHVGDVFTPRSLHDYQLLTITGRAKAYVSPDCRTATDVIDEVHTHQSRHVYDAMSAIAVDESPVDEPKKKRTYRRRDLTAEASE